ESRDQVIVVFSEAEVVVFVDQYGHWPPRGNAARCADHAPNALGIARAVSMKQQEVRRFDDVSSGGRAPSVAGSNQQKRRPPRVMPFACSINSWTRPGLRISWSPGRQIYKGQARAMIRAPSPK